MNVEKIVYRKATIRLWDIGCYTFKRAHWVNFHNTVTAVLFFIDASDRARLEATDHPDGTVAGMLASLIAEPELLSQRPLPPFVIVCNKQDVPGAMSCAEVGAHLDIHRMFDGTPSLFGCRLFLSSVSVSFFLFFSMRIIILSYFLLRLICLAFFLQFLVVS